VRFLIDAQLPPALAGWIRSQGHDADHVFDVGLARADDRDIWSLAVDSSAVIVTKDEDFARRRVVAKQGPQVVWLRVGNTRRSQLLDLFGAGFHDMLDSLDRGEILVEVQRPSS
jgi:predicted nuclease of predicted toxin-antitoxin system